MLNLEDEDFFKEYKLVGYIVFVKSNALRYWIRNSANINPKLTFL